MSLIHLHVLLLEERIENLIVGSLLESLGLVLLHL
jgi:hypothetical protein